MSKKEKLPFWLGILLGMLLGMLIILVLIAPQHEAHKIAPAHAQSTATLEMTKPHSHAEKKHPLATKAVIKKEPRLEHKLATQPEKYGIALIIDDVGYDLNAVKRILNLSAPVAMSVLPDSPFAQQAATLSHQAGQVVMLHLPMQAEDPSLQVTEDFLHANMSKDDVRATFLRDLKKIPYVEGTNNHMGSKLTQLTAPMQWVMQLCQENGLFFVDSKTSSHSVAATIAKQAGIAWASRRIFLDHEMTLQAMQHAWQQARDCAAQQRRCIVIAHPRAKTVAFLENYLSVEDTTKMVSIKDLLQTSLTPERPEVHSP